MPNPFKRRPLLFSRTLIAAWLLVIPAGPVMAQSGPPVHGTIALEGTMEKVYRATNIVIVATIDGVEHAYRFSKSLFVHGSRGPDPLATLREGAAVVIHYRIEGGENRLVEIDNLEPEGLTITEGRVSKIDRRHRQLTIRFDNGTTERLQLTENAAGALLEVGSAGPELRVRVYYVDDHGQKVVHYFKKVER